MSYSYGIEKEEYSEDDVSWVIYKYWSDDFGERKTKDEVISCGSEAEARNIITDLYETEEAALGSPARPLPLKRGNV